MLQRNRFTHPPIMAMYQSLKALDRPAGACARWSNNGEEIIVFKRSQVCALTL